MVPSKLINQLPSVTPVEICVSPRSQRGAMFKNGSGNVLSRQARYPAFHDVLVRAAQNRARFPVSATQEARALAFRDAARQSAAQGHFFSLNTQAGEPVTNEA